MKFAGAAFAGLAAVAFYGISFGQPPAAGPVSDYYPMNSRSIKIPIKYEKDRKSIRQVKLFVARNGENTWTQEAAVPPDRDFFTYAAKEDGTYWFTMVEEDLQGRSLPSDLTRTPPDLKVIVDTLQPRVQFTTAKRSGDDVIVEWFVDDKYPDENGTRVHFRPAGSEANWQEVTLPAGSKSGVRFPAGTANPVTVRVTAVDFAGNKGEGTRDIGATAANQVSTSMSPGGIASPTTPVTPPAGAAGGAGGAIPPPDFGGPLAPTAPGGATPMNPGANTGTGTGTAAPSAGQPLPTVDPKQVAPAVVPPAPGGTGNAGGAAPVAVWSAGQGTTVAPTVEVTRAQHINYLAFDMNYEVEARGPSGISRVDLWVTRDEGKTWLKWSQHEGKAPSVKVNLNVPANPQPEGNYGFRVVPVSGAGLSEREPVGGDAPDLRVVVDVTRPQLDLFPPTGDPNSPEVLVIQWKATDRNFGDDPITIEWSDRPTGPWQPAAAGGDVVQVAAGTPAQARRLPNKVVVPVSHADVTGSFAWRVPSGLPPRVYLKVTATDAAGNVREVVTRDPILVDLVKPKAKISGIVTPIGGTRP